MPSALLEGLPLVDATGRLILATIVVTLMLAIAGHVVARARYAALRRDLRSGAGRVPQFTQPVLERIFRDGEQAARRGGEPNTQAIVEDGVQAGLAPLLLAERFVRAATGLVLILGLLGTFYGLTLSIGKLVHLVSGDAGATADVAQTITHGLTDALAGMTVAFSNSLVGIGSAVVLTIVGIVNNLAERRTGLMVEIETALDRHLATLAPASRPTPGDAVASFGESVARLENAVARFDSALRGFAANTKDLREIRLEVALKPGPGP
jgi:hypothetical protein